MIAQLTERTATTWIEYSEPPDEEPSEDDPGKVLYDTWTSLPDDPARWAYVDSLTAAQRGQFMDYRHRPLETRLTA